MLEEKIDLLILAVDRLTAVMEESLSIQGDAGNASAEAPGETPKRRGRRSKAEIEAANAAAAVPSTIPPVESPFSPSAPAAAQPPTPPAAVPAPPPAAPATTSFTPPGQQPATAQLAEDPRYMKIKALAIQLAAIPPVPNPNGPEHPPIRPGGDVLVVDLLSRYGATSLPELPKDQYDTVIQHFEYVLAAPNHLP